MPILIYALKRLLEAIPVVLVIVTLTFFLVRWVPGGPFDAEKALPPDVLQALNTHYGLDKTLGEQYLRYVGNLLQGNLGPSYKHEGWHVAELLLERIPVSFTLGAFAMLFAVLFGLSAGLIAAMRQNTLWDYGLMSLAMIGICLPSFVLGPLMVLFFSLHLKWFSVGGWDKWSDALLPIFTLSLLYTGHIARLFRVSMLDVANQDYIRAAKAKGIPLWRVVILHAGRNAIGPVLNYLGPACASILSGSLIIETVFNIPGIGRLFLQAITDRDDPVIIGIVLFFAVVVIFFNFWVDVILTCLNPRRAETK